MARRLLIAASLFAGLVSPAYPGASFPPGGGSGSTAVRPTFADGISAAGATLGTATPLTSDVNFVTTTPAASGVSLAAYNAGLGGLQRQEVFNEGANALAVYPPVSTASIKAGTTTTTAGLSVSLASGTHGTFYCVSATLCRQGP